MGLREIDRQAVEQAMREFDSIGRDKFLRKYGFGPAREYFIVQGDALYDSKAVLGAAHGYAVPEAGPLGREDFSGGEQNTAKRLRQLGVEVKKITLKAVLEQVLDLQAKWKAAKTDTMRKRGRLVEEVGPVVLRGVIKASSADDFSTEGSNGTGSISRVPWMRIFRPEHSPAATEGWYLVYLFAADGSMVYLSLNQGTTESVRVKSGQRFKSRPKDELATKVAEARALINKEGDDLDKYLLEIKLGDKGPLGRGYERGNVLARQYDSGDLPNETGLRRDLLEMLALLGKLYAEARPAAATLAAVAESLLLDESYLRRIEKLLDDKPQMIFYGPPGTGKTFVARKLAEHYAATSGGRVELVQFHPSYAYEDFVEGYRPVKGGGFALRPGPLKRIAKDARDAGIKAKARGETPPTYVLIIDELNRGNVPKVFGELYFLLEYRDEEVTLQYSDEPFSLPDNLWIIGTMNTADRSIALVDTALRRRFYFFPFIPNEPPVEGLLRLWLEKHKPSLVWVADVVDRANEALDDRDASIGPSYFMKETLDDEWVELIWEHSILPYLAEHFVDDRGRLAGFNLATLRSRPVTGAEADQDDDALSDSS